MPKVLFSVKFLLVQVNRKILINFQKRSTGANSTQKFSMFFQSTFHRT